MCKQTHTFTGRAREHRAAFINKLPDKPEPPCVVERFLRTPASVKASRGLSAGAVREDAAVCSGFLPRRDGGRAKHRSASLAGEPNLLPCSISAGDRLPWRGRGRVVNSYKAFPAPLRLMPGGKTLLIFIRTASWVVLFGIPQCA